MPACYELAARIYHAVARVEVPVPLGSGGGLPIDQIFEMLTDEMRYKLMRTLAANPEMSQRDLARELGVSLGKINYCLQALVRKGSVKARNFKNSQSKGAYMYLLTRRGIKQKAALTMHFLDVKIQEYERLRTEIDQMRIESLAARSASEGK